MSIKHLFRARPDTPSNIDLLSELPMGIMEYLLYKWHEQTPRRISKGDPVMLLPGFTTHEVIMSEVKSYLERSGFDVRYWNQGFNTGYHTYLLEKTIVEVKKFHFETDKKVTLIGHSLGGIYSRLIAHYHPELIEQVITMGTPYSIDIRINEFVRDIFPLVSPESRSRQQKERITHILHQPLEVPLSAIYTKCDGVVHWEDTMVPEYDTSCNIEAFCTHGGLIVDQHTFSILTKLMEKSG